jgi:hypothetical protein
MPAMQQLEVHTIVSSQTVRVVARARTVEERGSEDLRISSEERGKGLPWANSQLLEPWAERATCVPQIVFVCSRPPLIILFCFRGPFFQKEARLNSRCVQNYYVS